MTSKNAFRGEDRDSSAILNGVKKENGRILRFEHPKEQKKRHLRRAADAFLLLLFFCDQPPESE